MGVSRISEGACEGVCVAVPGSITRVCPSLAITDPVCKSPWSSACRGHGRLVRLVVVGLQGVG